MFVMNEEGKKFDLKEGIHSTIKGFGGGLMAVENKFEKGAVAPGHKHVHEQIAYIVSGKFEFSLNGEKRLLKAGDSLYAASQEEHGCVCIEEGTVLDVFSPQREDFLQK
ncbi:MAG TPA: cupin domain-containing protein [Clostridia bacterium]|nr:cupin domain-containing protein [Clostridia bacterium]